MSEGVSGGSVRRDEPGSFPSPRSAEPSGGEGRVGGGAAGLGPGRKSAAGTAGAPSGPSLSGPAPPIPALPAAARGEGGRTAEPATRTTIDAVFAVPGDLATPTGGYAYGRRMLELVPEHGVALRHLQVPGSFPHPSTDDLAATARLLGETAPGAVLLVDGLAFGALPAELVAALGCPTVALVHHPLAFETGLDPVRRDALFATERAALALARRVVATSRFTARLLAAEFGVPPERITVAEPGTEPAARARGSGRPVRLLAIGAVSPRKGYDLLIEALRALTDLDWHATIAGALDRDPATASALRAAITASGLDGRIALAGAVADADLAVLYAGADLFVSPSRFEGYGMALTEALARGLPLVASTGGATAETVPDDAAVKVPPGDAAALREALRRMIADPTLRHVRAEAAWAAAARLPRWRDTAGRLAQVLKEAAR